MTLSTLLGRWTCAALAACAALWTAPLFAGGGPENVFLIVNPRGPKSMEVANHYIALRHIPPSNIFYLPLPPNNDSISGLDFREKVLKPTLATIERRGLADQIDQIVYSCQIPWRVDLTAMFPAAKNPQLRPIASLTGATYLYQFLNGGGDAFLKLDNNFYYAPGPPAPTVTRAFRREYRWGPLGMRVAEGGLQYFLATQLGSTSPTGNTTEEIIHYLERAAAADGARPEGGFYYMKNSDVRTQARQAGFPTAVAEITALGLKAAIVTGIVPTGRGAVNGLTAGSPHVPLRTSGCVLTPGALVDNLTSQGGVMARPAGPNPQTRISEYLRLGAAGASGTVVEPYAIAEKFPSPALHVHYARGSSMAEAFYQSIQGPYQLLVLGDPLCQPWAAIPKVTIPGVADGAVLTGTVELKPTVTLPAGRGVSRLILYVNGKQREQQDGGESFSLDTATLPDGRHELRVVAIDDTPLETQGRWIGEVIVKNGRDALSLTTTEGPRTSAAQIPLTVTSTVDAEAVVFHNGRELGRVKGRSGKLTVAAERLGKGPVELQARIFTKPILSSPLLRLEIE